MQEIIPIILFAYNRPHTLTRTLDCLRENHVPLIYAFCDGPKTLDDRERVDKVHELFHNVDWCEIHITERETNLGLGKSLLAGVNEVIKKHPMVIVFEDDLICVPGTYQYLCAALQYYKNDNRVMSVTGWTHPSIIPHNITDQPYFDGRAECLVWGTWARAWTGMDNDAKTIMWKCKDKGLDIYKYGADLVEMAQMELKRNIWAVRFLYLHMLNQGLCMRPPWSMVEHIGVGPLATNAGDWSRWVNPPLKASPPIPQQWPDPVENPECSLLQQKAFGARPTVYRRLYRSIRSFASKIFRVMTRGTTK